MKGEEQWRGNVNVTRVTKKNKIKNYSPHPHTHNGHESVCTRVLFFLFCIIFHFNLLINYEFNSVIVKPGVLDQRQQAQPTSIQNEEKKWRKQSRNMGLVLSLI